MLTVLQDEMSKSTIEHKLRKARATMMELFDLYNTAIKNNDFYHIIKYEAEIGEQDAYITALKKKLEEVS